MDTLRIYKMSGSGNDFVVIDNRDGRIAEEEISDLARRICRRRVSVGADGLILIEPSSSADFRMRIVNPDGGEAEMCGNGSRCVCRIASELGIASGEMCFETLAGLIHGRVDGDMARVELTDVEGVKGMAVETDFGKVELQFLNTGVPHVVVFSDDLEGEMVVEKGRALRRHDVFQPDGTNVNFVSRSAGQEIAVRTYERGVEDETLSCGTGSVASAVAHSVSTGVDPPITVRTRSGECLTVSFSRRGSVFRDVMMEGPVRKVFEGDYFA